MKLHDVNRGVHKHRSRKRIGRGPGSGQGKTAGRGHKGQRSNPGYAALPIFEGGTMPLVRRIPKRGFTNIFAPDIAEVNIGDLEQLFQAGDHVDAAALKAKGLLKGRYDELKVLGDGELTKKLTVSAHRFSASARAKIEQAGGEVVVVPGRTPVSVKNADKVAARKAARKIAAGKSGD
ncbi:MAG: 50S ribosomal protein L15 [Pirellulaceae bacterium]